MKILIKGGRVIDPANDLDGLLDVLIDNGKITKVAKGIRNGADQTIDAEGKIVAPGIVDMHVHLRQPGREDKETVATGTAAAARGGVTSVLAMPNTTPAIDAVEVAGDLQKIIKKDALVNVFICAAITRGREGKELTDFAKLKKAGAVAVSDDGSSVEDDSLMQSAFKLAKRTGINVVCHSEDRSLSADGVVNAGFTATRLGLRGVSKESEYKRVSRDIALAHKAGAAVHICHVSCKETVEIIREAKNKGIKVTCETAPHYFSLSEEAVLAYDTNMKMNPPLRSKDDVEAIKQGLKDGTIDVIASDHAPHTENEKEIEFDRAEFGVVGLETELAASITELIEPGICNWPKLTEKLSLNPAKILGINKGTLSVGAEADIVVISPEEEWTVRKNELVSKSRNSPFIGRKLKGRVDCTICKGKVVYKG
jgi:dihydroorotase